MMNMEKLCDDYLDSLNHMTDEEMDAALKKALEDSKDAHFLDPEDGREMKEVIHAHWIDNTKSMWPILNRSHCNEPTVEKKDLTLSLYKYCPFCGATMDEPVERH